MYLDSHQCYAISGQYIGVSPLNGSIKQWPGTTMMTLCTHYQLLQRTETRHILTRGWGQSLTEPSISKSLFLESFPQPVPRSLQLAILMDLSVAMSRLSDSRPLWIISKLCKYSMPLAMSRACFTANLRGTAHDCRLQRNDLTDPLFAYSVTMHQTRGFQHAPTKCTTFWCFTVASIITSLANADSIIISFSMLFSGLSKIFTATSSPL